MHSVHITVPKIKWMYKTIFLVIMNKQKLYTLHGHPCCNHLKFL